MGGFLYALLAPGLCMQIQTRSIYGVVSVLVQEEKVQIQK